MIVRRTEYSIAVVLYITYSFLVMDYSLVKDVKRILCLNQVSDSGKPLAMHFMKVVRKYVFQ